MDSAIYEAVLTVMESLIADYDQGGHVRERHGSALPGIAPSNAYPTRDGREMVIGANQDTVFRRLCEVMGRPELAEDARFSTHRARGANAEALDALISDWTRGRDALEMIDGLAAGGVPVGLAYRAPEMLSDPHFAARGAIVRVDDPARGSVAMQNVFPRLSETPGAVRSTGPALGGDTEAVLTGWLDLPSDRIKALRAGGVI